MQPLLAETPPIGDIISEALRRFTPIAIGAAIFGVGFWFWIRFRVRRKMAEKLAQRDRLMEKSRQQQKRRGSAQSRPAPSDPTS